jgi:hypothetical protein
MRSLMLSQFLNVSSRGTVASTTWAEKSALSKTALTTTTAATIAAQTAIATLTATATAAAGAESIHGEH